MLLFFCPGDSYVLGLYCLSCSQIPELYVCFHFSVPSFLSPVFHASVLQHLYFFVLLAKWTLFLEEYFFPELCWLVIQLLLSSFHIISRNLVSLLSHLV